jgi:hypothetical protein
MVVEKRIFKTVKPPLYTGSVYEFHRTENGYFMYEEVHRGRGVVNRYQAEFYRVLPDLLQYAWDKGVSF